MPVRQLLIVAQGRASLLLIAAGLLLISGLAGAVVGRRPVWLIASLLAIGLFPALPTSTNGYTGWLAGVPHWPAHREMQADSLLKTIGFVMFPWVALLPVAMAQVFSQPPTSEPKNDDPVFPREQFVLVLLVAWIAIGCCGSVDFRRSVPRDCGCSRQACRV